MLGFLLGVAILAGAVIAFAVGSVIAWAVGRLVMLVVFRYKSDNYYDREADAGVGVLVLFLLGLAWFLGNSILNG